MKGQVDENDVCFIFIPFGHVVSVLGSGLWNLYGGLDKQY